MFMSVDDNILTTYKPKIKEPIFQTEDGLDIFEGDLFYYVKFVQYNNTLGKPFEIVKGNYPTFKYSCTSPYDKTGLFNKIYSSAFSFVENSFTFG